MSAKSRRGIRQVGRDFVDTNPNVALVLTILAIGALAAAGYATVRSASNSSQLTLTTTATDANAATDGQTLRSTSKTTSRTTKGSHASTGNSHTSRTAASPPIGSQTGSGSASDKSKHLTPNGSKHPVQTRPTPGPAHNLRWSASPAAFSIAPGGHMTGFVVVKNLDSTPGFVLSPGCPSGPSPASFAARVPRVAPLCAPAGKATLVEANQSHTWEWAWNGTVDGKRGTAPLAPGKYAFTIGGATVHVIIGP